MIKLTEALDWIGREHLLILDDKENAKDCRVCREEWEPISNLSPIMEQPES